MSSKFYLLLILNVIILTIFTSHNLLIIDSNHDIDFNPHFKILPRTIFIEPPIEINSDSDFISFGFSGTGTEIDPYLIEDLNLSGNGTFISISGISSYFKISNSVFTGVGSYIKAISIVNSQNGKIENNRFINLDGVVLFESNQNSISHNTFFYDSLDDDIGQTGISLLNSDNNDVLNNTLSNYSFTGIKVSGDYNYILGNNIIENKHAIIVTDSHNQIEYNFISKNIFGITTENQLKLIINNSIKFNFIENSNSVLITEWGLLLRDNTQNTMVQNNNFVGLPNLYAFDDGINNSFENNYWDDWTGTGSYQIGGSASNFDMSPLSSINSESVTLINFNTGQTSENVSPDESNIPQLLALALLSVVGLGLGFLYVRRKKEPSFSKFIQLGERDFLKNIYNKIIVGLEIAKTNVISFETPNFQLEGFEVKSIVNYFPEDIRKELISNIKGRSILVLIEIAYNDPQRTNSAYLSKILNIPPSTLTTEIKKLIKLNYIDPYISKQVLEDPRYKNYAVSEKGFRFLYLMKETLKITLEQMDSSQKFENYTETELGLS